MGAGNNFITTSANTFSTGSEFLVWDNLGFSFPLNRTYVWIDKNRKSGRAAELGCHRHHGGVLHSSRPIAPVRDLITAPRTAVTANVWTLYLEYPTALRHRAP